MPIDAIIFIALKRRQTSERRFLNKKIISERWDANKKIDIDAANCFLIKKRRSKYVKAISLNLYGRAMRYTFFFLLETLFLGLRLKLLRKSQFLM